MTEQEIEQSEEQSGDGPSNWLPYVEGDELYARMQDPADEYQRASADRTAAENKRKAASEKLQAQVGVIAATQGQSVESIKGVTLGTPDPLTGKHRIFRRTVQMRRELSEETLLLLGVSAETIAKATQYKPVVSWKIDVVYPTEEHPA